MINRSKILSDEQVAKILVDHEDGFKIKELAERYFVSTSTINRILGDNNAEMRHKDRRNKRRSGRANPKGRTYNYRPCGTDAAYQRHIRNGEMACEPCLDAHRTAMRSYAKKYREMAKIKEG